MTETGVVILCGASGSNGEPAEDAVFPGTTIPMPWFLGGEYKSLGLAMNDLDVPTVNMAQAGGYSDDMPDTRFRGYMSQLQRGLILTNWLGDPKARAVVFDGMNDCLHSVPFTPECADNYIKNLKEAVNFALAEGKQVVVLQLAAWESLDLTAAFAPYGITEIISEANYAILVAKHEAAFGSRTDMIYLDAWCKMTTIDGIHPDEKSQTGAARDIKKALR